MQCLVDQMVHSFFGEGTLASMEEQSQRETQLEERDTINNEQGHKCSALPLTSLFLACQLAHAQADLGSPSIAGQREPVRQKGASIVEPVVQARHDRPPAEPAVSLPFLGLLSRLFLPASLSTCRPTNSPRTVRHWRTNNARNTRGTGVVAACCKSET